MPLPQLNVTPKYELTVPSTSKRIKYRPFLVKEEKILLLAMESQDPNQIINAVTDTIRNCLETDAKTLAKLTTFDVEYIFVQLRGQSVGEKVEVKLKCQNDECDHETTVMIALDDIKVDVPKINNVIELTEDISVEMKWPSFEETYKNNEISEADGAQAMYIALRKSIAAVHTGDTRIDASEVTTQELDAFIEETNSDQFKKLVAYIEAMPKLTHTVKYTCEKCGTENTVTLEGMEDFF